MATTAARARSLDIERVDRAVEEAIGAGEPGTPRCSGTASSRSCSAGLPSGPSSPSSGCRRSATSRSSTGTAICSTATPLRCATAVSGWCPPSCVSRKRPAPGRRAAYLVQPLVPREHHPQRAAAEGHAGDGRRAAGHPGRAGRDGRRPELGLDAQASNWAVEDGGLACFDLSTPLMRSPEGQHRLRLAAWSIYRRSAACCDLWRTGSWPSTTIPAPCCSTWPRTSSRSASTAGCRRFSGRLPPECRRPSRRARCVATSPATRSCGCSCSGCAAPTAPGNVACGAGHTPSCRLALPVRTPGATRERDPMTVERPFDVSAEALDRSRAISRRTRPRPSARSGSTSSRAAGVRSGTTGRHLNCRSSGGGVQLRPPPRIRRRGAGGRRARARHG